MPISISKLFVATLLSTSLIMPALAKFDDKNRSVNGTGDTLPAQNFEVGFASLDYGITDNLMVNIPYSSISVGGIQVGLRYKIPLAKNIYLSPQGSIAYYPHFSYLSPAASLTLGINLTDDKRNTLALTAVATYGTAYYTPKKVEFSSTPDNIKQTNAVFLAPALEYDHYTTSGNLFYVGAAAIVPYLGFTWAFENVHIGAISSLATLFFPLPYIYVRF